MLQLKYIIPGAVFAVLSACGASAPAEPQGAVALFPDEPVPDVFSRAYSLTESMDGTIRVFAKERRNDTFLYEMRKQPDGQWSEPKEMDIPRQFIASGPSFSPADGMLYFATDATLPSRGTGKDLNIWRMPVDGDGWGAPEPLSGAINTGASETTPTMDSNGVLYFSTDHPRSGANGLSIMMAEWDDGSEDWIVSRMPDGINSERADSHLAVTADGNRLFFYSHREPKLGVVDIWMTTKAEDGTWQAPENIGAPVNTPGIDYGAGLSGDNSLLFFSREGALMSIPLNEALSGAAPES